MRKLTIEEMKEVPGGSYHFDLLGCNDEAEICCIRIHASNETATTLKCGDYAWYLQY